MNKVKQTKIFPEKTLSFQKVKEQVDVLSEEKSVKLGLRIGLISLGLMVLSLTLTWLKLPPEVPFLYSKPYGESQLIPVWGLWFLPVVGLVIEMIAIRTAGGVIEEDKLLAQVLVWSTTIAILMGLITLVQVLWIML